jgi:hypothetical protein
MTFKDFIIGLSVNNVFNPDVSLLSGTSRRLPISANLMVGGFLDLAPKYILFPHATAVYNQDEYYASAGLKFNTPYVNLAGAYSKDKLREDLSASIGMNYKRTFFGLTYAQPMNTDGPGEFRVFLNSSLIRDFEAFQSDFAKKIKQFY